MSVALAAPPIERYRLSSGVFHEMIEKGILGEIATRRRRATPPSLIFCPASRLRRRHSPMSW